MSWIKIIEYKEAQGKLKRLYDKIKGPDDSIDNVMQIHGLRPHTMEGHLSLYKSVLHHSSNSLPKWYLETLGVYVSKLNSCNYCVRHHSIGVKRNLDNDEKYESIISAISNDLFERVFEHKFIEGINYAKLLTKNHSKISESHIEGLRVAGLSDEEILEINQVVSYFNYVNRTVVGLGVNLEDSNIGLAPSSNDSNDWSHK